MSALNHAGQVISKSTSVRQELTTGSCCYSDNAIRPTLQVCRRGGCAGAEVCVEQVNDSVGVYEYVCSTPQPLCTHRERPTSHLDLDFAKLWGNMIGRRFPEYCSFMSSQEILCFKRLSSLGVLQLCELADFCRCLSTYVLAVLGGTVDQLLNHLQREVRFL